ncbi:MAG: response regulator [Nitrospirales bacterium]|nr:response regulator [Nitrospira sp.]MDR4501392.1 response regulator [Nitrospirales bacterium]
MKKVPEYPTKDSLKKSRITKDLYDIPGLYLYDHANGHLVVDRKFAEILGTSRSAFTEWKDLLSFIHSKDHERFQRVIDQALQAKKGSMRQFSTTVQTTTEGDPPQQVLIVGRAYHTPEDRLRVMGGLRLVPHVGSSKPRDDMIFANLAANDAPVGLFVVDEQYIYRYANRAYLQDVLKKPPDESVIGRSVSDVLGSGWLQIQPKLDQALQGERVAFDVVSWPSLTRELKSHFIASYMPLEITEDVSGVVAAIVDITDLRLFESAQHEGGEKFHELALRLEKSISECTQALGTSPHHLQVLTYGLNLTEYRERIRVAQYLHDTVQHIMILGKWRVAKWRTLPRAELRLHDFFDEIETLFAEGLEATMTMILELSPAILQQNGLIPALEWLGENMKKYGLAVKLFYEKDIPAISDTEGLTIFHAVRELYINIIQHAQVSDAVARVEIVRNHLQISVTDRGIGFDTREAGSDSSSQKFATKLGLLGVVERIKKVGGWVKIFSEPGKGTAVILNLPIKDHKNQEFETTHTAKEEIISAPLRHTPQELEERWKERFSVLSRKRVLAVSPHIMVRQGICNILETFGDIQVVGQFDDEDSLLDAISEFNPDVVILDVTAPEQNEIQITRLIKTCYPEILIIGLIETMTQETREKFQEAGAFDLISKTNGIAMLHQTIMESAH